MLWGSQLWASVTQCNCGLSSLTASLLMLQVAKRELQESNWQLLAKVKKAEAERKQLKQQQWK